jgi:hypothetical protein
VAAIREEWKPSVYRLGSSRPELLPDLGACVAKAQRLQAAPAKQEL